MVAPSARLKAVAALNHGFPEKGKRRKINYFKVIEWQKIWESWPFENNDHLLILMNHFIEHFHADNPAQAFAEFEVQVISLQETREYRAEWKPDPKKVEWAPLTDVDENGVRYFNYGESEMYKRLKNLQARRNSGWFARASREDYRERARFFSKQDEIQSRIRKMDEFCVAYFIPVKKYGAFQGDEKYYILMKSETEFSFDSGLTQMARRVCHVWNDCTGRNDSQCCIPWRDGQPKELKEARGLANRFGDLVANIGWHIPCMYREAMVKHVADLVRAGKNVIVPGKNQEEALKLLAEAQAYV